MTDKCPLCGSRVLYRGLATIECAGAPKPAQPERVDYNKSPAPIPAVPAQPACPNYKFNPTSWDWLDALQSGMPIDLATAIELWKRGRKIEWYWRGRNEWRAALYAPDADDTDVLWRVA